MNSQPPPALLARLDAQEARLATQDAVIARLEARLTRHQVSSPPPSRRVRRGRAFALATLALLIALVPLGLLAATPFTDLTGGVHDTNIEAIYDAGITTGCDPGVAYCPNDPVTRQEMASFIARAAGLGANPPVANAQTLQGYAPSTLLRVARGQSVNPVPLTSATADVAALTLRAPGAGFILANGAMTILNPDGCPCYITMWLSVGTDEIAGTSVDIPFKGGFENLATSWVFPVNPGTHTITVHAGRSGGTAAIGIANVTALFVPFGPTGSSALDLP